MPKPAVNPLDAYVTSKPASFARDFKVPTFPKIGDSLTKGKSLADGLASHDAAMEQFRKDLETSISERIRQTEASVTTAPSTPAAVVPPAIIESTPAPVTSVNGEIGDVVLTTDDIAEGDVNFYLTQPRWMEFFDRFGFHKNIISSSESIMIPSERNLVMYGPLTVEGLLVIDGYFVNLTP